MRRNRFTAIAGMLAFAAPQMAHAQNEATSIEIPPPSTTDNVAATSPAQTRPAPVNEVAPESAPASAAQESTPVPAPAPSAPVEVIEAPEIINPYANSYNELLPIDAEEDEGFDDWGLLGLLGLIGLFGLRRRDRIVYAERLDGIDRRH